MTLLTQVQDGEIHGECRPSSWQKSSSPNGIAKTNYVPQPFFTDNPQNGCVFLIFARGLSFLPSRWHGQAEDWHRIVSVNDVTTNAKGMAQELCRHKVSAVSFAGNQQALGPSWAM